MVSFPDSGRISWGSSCSLLLVSQPPNAQPRRLDPPKSLGANLDHVGPRTLRPRRRLGRPPFRWDAQRRFQLRCELDAAFFHLYGLGRDDTDYIMDTFPIVRKNDEKAHNTYRTKDTILALHDAFATAIRTATPWTSPLSPPPTAPDGTFLPWSTVAPAPPTHIHPPRDD